MEEEEAEYSEGEGGAKGESTACQGAVLGGRCPARTKVSISPGQKNAKISHDITCGCCGRTWLRGSITYNSAGTYFTKCCRHKQWCRDKPTFKKAVAAAASSAGGAGAAAPVPVPPEQAQPRQAPQKPTVASPPVVADEETEPTSTDDAGEREVLLAPTLGPLDVEGDPRYAIYKGSCFDVLDNRKSDRWFGGKSHTILHFLATNPENSVRMLTKSAWCSWLLRLLNMQKGRGSNPCADIFSKPLN